MDEVDNDAISHKVHAKLFTKLSLVREGHGRLDKLLEKGGREGGREGQENLARS